MPEEEPEPHDLPGEGAEKPLNPPAGWGQGVWGEGVWGGTPAAGVVPEATAPNTLPPAVGIGMAAGQVPLEGRSTSGLTGVAALADVGSLSEVTTDIPADGEPAGGPPFGFGTPHTLVAEPGDLALTGNPVNFEVRQRANAQDTYDAEVIPALWSAAGINSTEPLQRIERQLLQFKALAEALENAKRGILAMRGHNGGPDLEDWPDIDIAGIDDTLAAVGELRVQVENRNPDPKLLGFIQRFLEAGKRALWAFAGWVAKKGDKFFDGLMSSLSTPQGAAGWAALANEMAHGRLAHDLHEASQIVLRVLAHINPGG